LAKRKKKESILTVLYLNFLEISTW